MLATAKTGKTWERFWKNAGEWTNKVEIRLEEQSEKAESSREDLWNELVS